MPNVTGVIKRITMRLKELLNFIVMDIYLLGLLTFIIIGVGFLRNILVDTKKIVIPKWLDFSIVIILTLLTIYVLYDTFLVISS